MKARVNTTGKIVDVVANGNYYDTTDNKERYYSHELDFNDTPDYWTRLEHQYAGMAMQGMVRTVGHDRMYPPEKIAIYAVACATALVEKLKSKNNG